MIVPVSGFGKGDPGEGKAPEKAGALQNFAGSSAELVIRKLLFGGELQMSSGRPGKPITNSEAVKKSKALLSPALSSRGGEGEESR